MKKKMNTLTLTALALTMILSFTACSQSAPIDTSAAETGPVQPADSPSTQVPPETSATSPDSPPSSTEPIPPESSDTNEAETGPDHETEENAIAVLDLYNEFQADPEAATSKYSGKSIVSTGVVIRTGPDIHGTPSIELSDTEGGNLYAVYVMGSFDQLNEVSVGETVTIKGNFHVFSTSEWGVVMKQGEVL